MRKGRIASLVIAALVAGAVAGNAASGYAATTDTTTATSTPGIGLRLGTAMREAGARLADIVAKLTGTTVEQVQEQRQDGSSFAEIAAKKDVSADKVVDTTLDIRKEVLDARVKAGTLTQEQADGALDRMTERVKERVTSQDEGCTDEGATRNRDGGRGKGGGNGEGRGKGEGRGMGAGGGKGAGRGMGAGTGTQQ